MIPTDTQIIDAAEDLCKKFVDKVESGRARSVETYSDCKALLSMVEDRRSDDPR